jgi:RNA polymerase sigma-70 factor (ECF subfamily)
MTANEQLSQEPSETRLRFDAACQALRPELHRFCTRMTGSPWDGEDVLHDALVLAFYRYAELREGSSLKAWLFRIAHNKCIDFLRARRLFGAVDDEHSSAEEAGMDEAVEQRRRVERALTSIVTELPPRQRACIVLKDVLDWSLEETAEITGCSVGAVKAALHRGRSTLEQTGQTSVSEHKSLRPEQRELVERYLAAFNRHDWDGVRALLSDEARLEVVHGSESLLRDAPYFANYSGLPWKWKLALAQVDGVEAIVHFRQVLARGSACQQTQEGTWLPHCVVQIGVAGNRITHVRDYIHVDYMLQHCDIT